MSYFSRYHKKIQEIKLNKPEFVEKHTEPKEQLEVAQLEFTVNKMKQLLEDSIAVQAPLAAESPDTIKTATQKRRLNKI